MLIHIKLAIILSAIFLAPNMAHSLSPPACHHIYGTSLLTTESESNLLLLVYSSNTNSNYLVDMVEDGVLYLVNEDDGEEIAGESRILQRLRDLPGYLWVSTTFNAPISDGKWRVRGDDKTALELASIGSADGQQSTSAILHFPMNEVSNDEPLLTGPVNYSTDISIEVPDGWVSVVERETLVRILLLVSPDEPSNPRSRALAKTEGAGLILRSSGQLMIYLSGGASLRGSGYTDSRCTSRLIPDWEGGDTLVGYVAMPHDTEFEHALRFSIDLTEANEVWADLKAAAENERNNNDNTPAEDEDDEPEAEGSNSDSGCVAAGGTDHTQGTLIGLLLALVVLRRCPTPSAP